MIEQIGEETKEEQQQILDQDEKSPSSGDNGKKKRVQKRTETRNKQGECEVCHRKMRSDTIKRHMTTHEKLFTLKEDEMRVSDERVKQERSMRKIAEEMMKQMGEEIQEVQQQILNQDKQSFSDKCCEDGKKNRVQERTETRNKQVECKVCFGKMRSDNLKRHMKKHQKVYERREEIGWKKTSAKDERRT